MARKVLTESCVIQCAHGGTVNHPSSDAIRTIGGLKPNFCTDILNAPISGCPVPYTPCTQVAATSSAMTEANVTGSGGTYALDVSGCQTDQGAALQIVSRANSNSATNVKSSADNKVEGEKATKEEKEKAKNKKEKERYNLYLLRESQDIFAEKVYKPLRPSRAFADIKTFYGTMDTNPLIREKIVPFTLAFVYIKLKDGNINEYRIISRGSLYGETFKDIKYKDEKNVARDYIPLYDGDEIEIFYSNVQLSKDKSKRETMLGKLLGIKFDPTDANKKDESFFLKDPNAIDSNQISQKTFKLQKEYDPVKEHKEKVKKAEAEGKSTEFKLYPLNAVMTIPDPLGQAEDLLNIYEWSYKTTFSQNDSHLRGLKQTNAYTYAVSSQIDYFYVSSDEQKEYDDNIKKLKKLYRTLADEVCKGEFASLIVKGENNIASLDEIITPAFDTAQNYLNEIRFINHSFFKNVLDGVHSSRHHHENHPYDEDAFVVSSKGLTCKYVGLIDFLSVNEENVYVRRRYAQKTKEYNDVNYGYLVLSDATDRYKPYQQNPAEMLALLVFSLFFSKAHKEKAKKSKVYESAKEFFYTLKNSRPMPVISDENIKNTKKLIDDQSHSYAKICKRENKLLEQFENIDGTNKEFAFDNSKIQAPKKAFSDLYMPKEFSNFFRSPTNPKELLLKAKDLITADEFKKVFKAYGEMDKFDSQLQEQEYLNTVMGLLYTFMEDKSLLDAEANINSPFNNEEKHLLSLAEHVIKLRNDITDDAFKSKIFNLPIREHYTKTLHSHIGHSMVQTERNKQGFTARQGNAEAFLKKYVSKKKEEETKLDLSNLLSSNFDISKESEKSIADYYESLKTIEGFASKAGDVAEKYGDDIDSEARVQITKIQNTPAYKTLLASIKTLSIFVAGVNVAIGVINYKKLKYNDIFPLIGDTYTTIDSFSKVAPKSKEAVVESVQKFLGEENFVKIASWKLMAKVGLVAIAISAVYDINHLQEDDFDGGVAIVTKNLTIIALMVAPGMLATVPAIGWIAALGVLAVELAWEFYLKDMFVDTPLESYIMKSLLFHKFDDDSILAPMFSPLGYAIYRYYSGKPYKSILFAEAVNAQHKQLVQGFDTLEDVQNFIGDNQDKYAELFNNALQYELSALKAVAFGYKVDVLDPESKDYYGMPQELQTTIKIPKEMLQNNIQIMLKIDTEYKTIYESPDTPLGKMPPMPKDFTYDIIERKFLRNGKVVTSNDINGLEAEMLSKKDISLLIVNRDIALKYKIQLHCVYDKAEYMPKETYTANQALTLKIEKLKITPLEGKEKSMLDNIVYARREKEKSLAKQKESE
ncbi:hypothetical protein [Sulfurimonas sp. HSL3-2]|uniref:hypothetical protein n=1 Tax=Hydrocurvibacter mobilis TaxID=3131936 RepID=UPI0031F95D1E